MAARLETTTREPGEHGLLPERLVALNGNEEVILRLVSPNDRRRAEDVAEPQ